MIMYDLLPKLDQFYFGLRDELDSFASVHANKPHEIQSICNEMESFDRMRRAISSVTKKI